MDQWIDVFQKFVFNIAVATLPFLSVFIIAWIKAQVELKMAQIEEIKPKFADALRVAVALAVQAAEQAGLADLIDDKKMFAIETAEAFLVDVGWEEFDLNVLAAAIEAEVLQMNQLRSGQEVYTW